MGDRSGAATAPGRPEFNKLMKALVPGDTVVVTKLDRLARSSRDLQNVLHELQGLSAGFVSQPMTDELEQTIRRLIDRKNKLPEESAEYAFMLRQLRGLLFSWGEAARIIEDPDPWDWVSTYFG